MFRIDVRLSAQWFSGLTDYENIITTEDTDKEPEVVSPRAFWNGVHVLQSSLGRLEREKGSQAHHAVELSNAQQALLHLKKGHAVIFRVTRPEIFQTAIGSQVWGPTWGNNMPISSTSLTANSA